MSELNSIADFLFLHTKDCLDNKKFTRLITSYKNPVAMYNHLNEAQKGLLSALKDKKSINVVWAEAAKLTLWLARIADLYEKEVDWADVREVHAD